MHLTNIAGFKTVNGYVKSKLDRLRGTDGTFDSLFPLMFSESGNVIWEETHGYRIEKTTYGDVGKEAERLSGAIASRFSGLPAGSVIGIAAENGPLWIALLWGVLGAGFRPLLINPALGRDILRGVLSDISAAAVITDGKAIPSLSADMLPAGCELLPAAELSGDFPARKERRFGTEMLFMSSGTSSRVKCCGYGPVQIREQILDAAYIIRRSPDAKKHCDGELKLLALLPFSHIFGFCAVYLWFSFFSRTFVKLNDLSPSTVINTVKKHRVTHIMAVPLFWEMTYEAAMREISARGEKTLAKFRKGLALSLKLDAVPAAGRLFRRAAMKEIRDGMFGDSIRFCVSGGSRIPKEVLEFFCGIGYTLRNGYGMTETGITSVELGSRLPVICSGSVGEPLPSAEYSLAGNGELISYGRSGALYTITDGVRTERGDRFNTRDLAERDASGRWYILGRSDELVIDSSGENLNPGLIEPLFSGCGAKEICLCSSLRPDGGTAATLVLYAGSYATGEAAERIRNAADEVLRSSGLTGRIGRVIVTRTPLIAEDDFKLNRRRIGERVSSGEIRPADISSENFEASDRRLYLTVRRAFEAALPSRTGDISDTADFFADCGGSSFEWFAMVSALSEELGTGFPSSAEGISTIKDLYTFVEGRL